MEDGGPSQTAHRVAAYRLDVDRVPADYFPMVLHRGGYPDGS